MLHLPKDVLRYILSFVKTDSFTIIGTVCSAFHGCYNRYQKITRTSKFLQSPQLLEQAPNIEFQRPYPLDDLITRNEIDVIPLLLSRGLLEWDPFCVERAAEVNSYRFFEWLIATDLAWLPENAYCSAAECGNLSLMIFLVERRVGYPDDRALTSAKKLGDRKIVEWLLELQLDRAYEMVQAAREDNVDAFEQMEVSDYGHVRMYITEACVNSSFGVLEFFRSSVGVGPTVADIAMATLFKKFGVLEWFCEFFPDLAKELP